MKINIVIKPILLYAAVTMSTTKKQIEDLGIIARTSMLVILGPIKITVEKYRIKINEEFKKRPKENTT